MLPAAWLAHTTMQGPTISSVYNLTSKGNGNGNAAQLNYYAATICVRKKQLYRAVKELQKVRRSASASHHWDCSAGAHSCRGVCRPAARLHRLAPFGQRVLPPSAPPG